MEERERCYSFILSWTPHETDYYLLFLIPESLWVLSRTKTLEGEAKTAVDTFFKDTAKELDTSKLVMTDFSEDACKFTSTMAISERPKP
jgi:hypothetical protein